MPASRPWSGDAERPCRFARACAARSPRSCSAGRTDETGKRQIDVDGEARISPGPPKPMTSAPLSCSSPHQLRLRLPLVGAVEHDRDRLAVDEADRAVAVFQRMEGLGEDLAHLHELERSLERDADRAARHRDRRNASGPRSVPEAPHRERSQAGAAESTTEAGTFCPINCKPSSSIRLADDVMTMPSSRMRFGRDQPIAIFRQRAVRFDGDRRHEGAGGAAGFCGGDRLGRLAAARQRDDVRLAPLRPVSSAGGSPTRRRAPRWPCARPSLA